MNNLRALGVLAALAVVFLGVQAFQTWNNGREIPSVTRQTLPPSVPIRRVSIGTATNTASEAKVTADDIRCPSPTTEAAYVEAQRAGETKEPFTTWCPSHLDRVRELELFRDRLRRVQLVSVAELCSWKSPSLVLERCRVQAPQSSYVTVASFLAESWAEGPGWARKFGRGARDPQRIAQASRALEFTELAELMGSLASSTDASRLQRAEQQLEALRTKKSYETWFASRCERVAACPTEL